MIGPGSLRSCMAGYLSIPEVALPFVLVTQPHAAPGRAAAAFVINTVLVVAFQIPVTAWMSRFPRRTALAIAGVVISISHLGFLGSAELPHRWAVPATWRIALSTCVPNDCPPP